MAWGAYLLGISTGLVLEFAVIFIWGIAARALAHHRLEMRFRAYDILG